MQHSTPRCQFAWGQHGAQQAAERGDILVVVDTLRFSTATVTALHHGGLIYPCPVGTDTPALARRINGEAAIDSYKMPLPGRFSLSPLSYLEIEPGTRVVLASPNGATCCQFAPRVPHLFVGTLVNAQAVAGRVAQLLAASDLGVTVLACGERWKTSTVDGNIRFALEDYLGAGAILSYLSYEQSAEAQACSASFVALRDRLEALLWECESGQELRAKSRGADVRHAMQLNVYETVPVMRGERLEAFMGKPQERSAS